MDELGLSERAGPEKGDASSRYALKFRRLEPGEAWEVSYLAFRNATSDPASIDIYKDGHGYNHYLAQKQPAVSGYIYFLDEPFWVSEGETLVVEFVGGGSSDDLEAWATGTKKVRS